MDRTQSPQMEDPSVSGSMVAGAVGVLEEAVPVSWAALVYAVVLAAAVVLVLGLELELELRLELG